MGGGVEWKLWKKLCSSLEGKGHEADDVCREWQQHKQRYRIRRDFPAGSVLKTLHFDCQGLWFDSWLGNKDPICCKVWPKKQNQQRRKRKYMMLGEWLVWLEGRSRGERKQQKTRWGRLWRAFPIHLAKIWALFCSRWGVTTHFSSRRVGLRRLVFNKVIQMVRMKTRLLQKEIGCGWAT